MRINKLQNRFINIIKCIYVYYTIVYREQIYVRIVQILKCIHTKFFVNNIRNILLQTDLL